MPTGMKEDLIVWVDKKNSPALIEVPPFVGPFSSLLAKYQGHQILGELRLKAKGGLQHPKLLPKKPEHPIIMIQPLMSRLEFDDPPGLPILLLL